MHLLDESCLHLLCGRWTPFFLFTTDSEFEHGIPCFGRVGCAGRPWDDRESLQIRRSAGGMKIGYRQTLSLTMKHRLGACGVRYKQMHTWFKRGNHLTLEQKHSLWFTCIFPIAVYGLDALGVSRSMLVQFQHHMKSHDESTSANW